MRAFFKFINNNVWIFVVNGWIYLVILEDKIPKPRPIEKWTVIELKLDN